MGSLSSWGRDLQEKLSRYAEVGVAPLLELFDPTAVWVTHGPEDLPWGGTYEGLDGIQTVLGRLDEHCEVVAYEAEKLVEGDDVVLALAHITVRYRASETEKTYRKVDVFHRSGDRVVKFEEFYDTASVLRDLGAH